MGMKHSRDRARRSVAVTLRDNLRRNGRNADARAMTAICLSGSKQRSFSCRCGRASILLGALYDGIIRRGALCSEMKARDSPGRERDQGANDRRCRSIWPRRERIRVGGRVLSDTLGDDAWAVSAIERGDGVCWRCRSTTASW